MSPRPRRRLYRFRLAHVRPASRSGAPRPFFHCLAALLAALFLAFGGWSLAAAAPDPSPASAIPDAQAPDAQAPDAQAPGGPTVPDGYGPVTDLLSERGKVRRRAVERILEAGDLSLVPGIVDALFFVPRRYRVDLFEALEGLTGEKLPRRYSAWVEYVGAHPGLAAREGYDRFKLSLLTRIDPRFEAVFYPGLAHRIRLEEIVWGGVPFDGIPSLDDPEVLPAEEAGYLTDREKVFGVALGGEARAYPLRILSWHEMANDVVGGEPVVLSYCTLCGSGILYSTRTPAGGAYRFATSGLLYRSNKLMVDRSTYTLWSNLTGLPVVGRLANTSARLEMLPMTLTTWGEWRRRHPETTVVALPKEMARRWGYDYVPGAADRARRGVSFPVWQKSEVLDRDEEIYAVEIDGAAKAYPVETVLAEGLVHDRLGEVELVLVADDESGAIRTYRSGGRTFRRPDGGAAEAALLDAEGRRWKITEAALEPDGSVEEEELAPLPRQPGHVAFWFGWFGFYPETEVYGATVEPAGGGSG